MLKIFILIVICSLQTFMLFAQNADFVGSTNNIPEGSTCNFTNLSSGSYDSVHWYFSGGTPQQSTITNPYGILYTTAGDYDVTLIIFSTAGNDTLTKPMYIHVFALEAVTADFESTTPHLITQGNSLTFQNLSDGYITSWQWQFPGSDITLSTVQNPTGIIYNTPGIWDVCLIVSNGEYFDTLCKAGYVIVTTSTWPDPALYFDTISNQAPNENPLTFLHLTPTTWGYVPGHNGHHKKAYADKCVNYSFSEIYGLRVPVVKSFAGSASSYVRFKIWSGTATPQTELGYKDVLISSMIPGTFNTIIFNTPIPVSGTFFYGYGLNYSTPQDTFVTYMVPDRGIAGFNSLYIQALAGFWQACNDVYYDIHTSLSTKVIGCFSNLSGIDSLIADNKLIIFPLPSCDLITVDYSAILSKNKMEIQVFDVLGKELFLPKLQISEKKYQIDFSNQTSGLYFVILKNENQFIKSKISIIK